MARYIDEELLIEKMTRLRGCSCYCSDGLIDEIEDIMSDLSTSDVAEREKIDNAIEEMDNINLNEYADNSYQIVNRCIEILKRNIGEQISEKKLNNILRLSLS